MRRMGKYLFFALACIATCSAQTVVLDSFNAGSATGAVRTGTTWIGSTTQNPTTLTVGGTARDDNGWGATGLTLNATGMNFITVTAQRDAGHAAGTFAIQFEDRNLNTQIFSVAASAFAIGSLTAVQIPITAWTGGFSSTQITGWSIGGGGVGTTPFRMTFDQLALNATATTGTIAPAATGNFGASTKAAGESITFTVSATGTTPLTYQWFKNSTTALTANVSATTAALTLTALTPSDAGSYTCTVTNAAGSIVSGAFTLTVTAQPASVTLGSLAATYTGSPRSVTAVTAPAGLPVNISYNGSATPPTDAGSFTVVATVNSPTYLGSATGTLVIARAPQAVAFAPLPATLRVGTPFALAATATSGGPVTFAVLTGAATLNGATLTPTSEAAITIRATQVGTTNYHPATTDLSFTTTKQTQNIDFAAVADFSGPTAPIALNATATSGLPVSFSVIGGSATLNGSALTPTASGVITVRASQPGNDTFNAAPDVSRTFTATLPVAPPPPPPPPPPGTQETRLANVSVRSGAGTGDQTLIVGLAVGGTGSKNVLIRGIGPGLTQFGVPGALADPSLRLFSAAGAQTNLNDDWGGGAVLSTAFSTVGAFALPAASKDAALLVPIATGAYTTQITAASGTGLALLEAYDFDATPTGARLVNISARTQVGTGENVLVIGFVITGSGSQSILLRAIGPGLTQFGVGGVLVDPQLRLFNAAGAQTEINDDWGGSAALAAAFAQTGAFGLPVASKDAALVVTLSPGAYTAQVSGVAATTGVALVEVYELR